VIFGTVARNQIKQWAPAEDGTPGSCSAYQHRLAVSDHCLIFPVRGIPISGQSFPPVSRRRSRVMTICTRRDIGGLQREVGAGRGEALTGARP